MSEAKAGVRGQYVCVCHVNKRGRGTSGATIGKRRVEAATEAARKQFVVERAKAKVSARVKEETLKVKTGPGFSYS